MVQIFGNFVESVSPSEEYLIIGFSPSSIPLKQRWRNNGLSADFLADYVTTFFPVSDSDENSAVSRRLEIKSAVSYVANELLENAMKFSDDTSTYPVSIQLQLHSNCLIFSVTNSLVPQKVTKFQDYIQTLIRENPEELYLHRLEHAAEDDQSSGLGLLTMINDYMAKLGWKFQVVQEEPKVIAVTTMVQLIV